MNQKSILITGCSSGIGLASATILKKRGYRVFASARKTEDVEKLTEQGFESVKLDVNDSASIQSALAHVLTRTGGTLDYLFNNSGFMQVGRAEDLTRDLIRAQFETNTFGPIELTRLVLPIMRKQGHGRIVQNSSILGIISFASYGAYCASKFALEGYSDALRLELTGQPIYVSIICPGPITSQLRANAYERFQQTLSKEHAETSKMAYQKLEQNYFQPSKNDSKIMQSPEAVVKKLIHALESPRPSAHYYVGLPATVMAFLRRILPDFALDFVLHKVR